MAALANNLFLRLHKLAAQQRQDENYCTEVLALLLQHLLDRQPDVADQRPGDLHEPPRGTAEDPYQLGLGIGRQRVYGAVGAEPWRQPSDALEGLRAPSSPALESVPTPA